MKEATRSRQAVAEIHWGRDRGAVIWIGNRVVHHFWALLAPYFRDVLLAPQRRTEDEVVAWSWREGVESRMPTGSELAALRKRLAGDQRAFSAHVRDGPPPGVNASSFEELGSVIERMVARFMALSDTELLTFVACTDSGLRLHSWGAMRAAERTFPAEQRRAAEAPKAESHTVSPAVERRRVPIALWVVTTIGAIAAGAWLWWRAPRPLEPVTSAATERSVAKDFTPGKASERFGEAREHVEQRVRGAVAAAPVVTASAVARATERGAATAMSAMSDDAVAGGGVLEEFESKRATPKSVLALPDALSPGNPALGGAVAGESTRTAGEIAGAVGSGATISNLNGSSERQPQRARDGDERESVGVERALALAQARAAAADRRALVAQRREPRVAQAREDLSGPEARDVASGASWSTLAAITDANWAMNIKVSAAPWSVRLLVDAIVPTEPVRSGAADELAAARSRALLAWRERLPAAFRPVRGRCGFVVEFPGAALRWQTPYSVKTVALNAGEGRAEISWAENEPPPQGLFELVGGEGHRAAIVEWEAGGAAMLRVAHGGHARFWVLVEGATEKFTWSGAGNGDAARRELALAPTAGAPVVEPVTLFDPATGWAVTRRITLTP